jgi:formyltetrahydrofolate hydrolase
MYAQQHGMDARFHAVAQRPRLLLMVSTHGHCLNDLLFRWKSGQLAVDIPAIVSNHPTYAALADSYGIPSTTCRCPPGPMPPPSARRSSRSNPHRPRGASTWWCWRATCRS